MKFKDIADLWEQSNDGDEQYIFAGDQVILKDEEHFKEVKFLNIYNFASGIATVLSSQPDNGSKTLWEHRITIGGQEFVVYDDDILGVIQKQDRSIKENLEEIIKSMDDVGYADNNYDCYGCCGCCSSYEDFIEGIQYRLKEILPLLN